MKTVDDIRLIFESEMKDADCFQLVADAWNEEVEGLNWQLGFYFSTTQRQAAKALEQARRLRKLRNELGEAKALCGLWSQRNGMQDIAIERLENLIKRIARGGK